MTLFFVAINSFVKVLVHKH